MKGLQVMLKALGIKITDSDLQMLETQLPRIPSIINEIIRFVGDWQKNFDGRLQMLEKIVADSHSTAMRAEQRMIEIDTKLNEWHAEILEGLKDARRTDDSNDRGKSTGRKRLN